MKRSLRVLSLLCWTGLFAGCSGQMIPLYETEYTHSIPEGIDKALIKEAVIDGATGAGWSTQDQGSSRILATYQIRIHWVEVSIYYSESYYRTQYHSSTAMKMYCSAGDKEKRRHIVSGAKNCPGDRPPQYINANYKIWIDDLVTSIDRSLASR